MEEEKRQGERVRREQLQELETRQAARRGEELRAREAERVREAGRAVAP